MAFQERNFSFGACEREFEKIQQALQGISEDIDQKLTGSSSSKASSFTKENEASTSSDDLNNLLTCEENHFEAQISKMKTVDLDMAVIIFEEQIKIGREMGQGKQSGKKELNQLRERLTRCFMRRAELVRGSGKPFEGEKYTSKTSRSISLTDAERTTDIDSVDDVSSLSISELQSLLVHNGIDFDENATKESLETIVKCEILQIEDGELDDWEPPGDNDIQWKSPATKSETEENFALVTTVDEGKDPHKPLTAETTSEGSEQTSNETSIADTDSFPEIPVLQPISDALTSTGEWPVSSDTTSAGAIPHLDVNVRPQEQLSSETHKEQSSSDTETREEALGVKSVDEPEVNISPSSAPVQVKPVQEPDALADSLPIQEPAAQSSPDSTPAQEPKTRTSPDSALLQGPEAQASQNPVAAQELKAQSSRNSAPVEAQNNGMSEEKENIHKKKIEEGTVVDWDPIPLLKDLYKPLERVEAIDFAKNEKEKKSPQKPNQQCKLDGYLEKLPVNQTKATLLKGWRKRYFKIATGKLYYFENHLATVDLGSILLTGSELKVPGEKTIQIIAQNTGDTITLRCSSSNESNDWYRALKRESAISTPVTAPVKVPLKLENPKSSTIIIDLGASTIKGGITGEDKPRVVFPAVYAVKTERKDGRKFTDNGIPDPSLCTCGYDAFRPEIRQKSKLVFPLRATLKVDKYSIKTRYIPGFIDKVIKDLRVDPTQSTIILSCQRNIGERDKEFLFDHLFGHLGVKAVYAQQQALLSLYSYKDTTGIIVDIGDHIDVLPVIEGLIIESGSSCLPQGGQLITEHLSRLLSEGGYRFFSEVESYIVRHVKEKTAFVSLDYENEKEIFHKALDVDMHKYNLPGKQTSITTSSERFRCAEGLFDPNKWGKDYEGIHKLVEKAVKQSGIDYRKEICRKIFLSGGSSLIEGLPERLQKELKYLMPETSHIQVHAAENRENAAFMGATVISEQPTFSQLLVTKEAWHDHGADIFKRMAQS